MKVSAVTSLYYSDPFIREFYNRLVTEIKKITSDYEIIFVNDGSPDHSAELVLELQENDPHITLIDLSRNFGHHRALQTGLKFADGDLVFLIDSDLEEDPELLTSFFERMQEGPEVDAVYGVQKKRKGAWFEKMSGKIHYSLFSALSKSRYPVNALSARLMTRRYVDGLMQFEEKESDLWGLFVLNGFREESITVDKKHKGNSTYSVRRKIELSINTITTLTHRPLYIISLLSMIMLLIAMIAVIVFLVSWIKNGTVRSQVGIIASVWLVGGLVMLALGIIGIYLSKMFLEVKDRPLSIIRKIYKRS